MRRILFPIILGVAGCAILISLGVWQAQRLAWKTDIIATIDATITAAPIALPLNPSAQNHKYLPVTVTGTLAKTPIYALVTPEGLGPGYRYIDTLTTNDGRRVMVDLGWVPLDALGRDIDSRISKLAITGNLHWPDEQDDWTPKPDPKGIWFARDVPLMAIALNAEPTFIVARDYQLLNLTTPLQTYPSRTLPLDSGVIKNDHLNYAITWFMLALVWAMMTGYLIFRIRKEARP